MSEEPKAAGPAPGIAEGLVERTKRIVADILTEWLKQPLAQVGRWVCRRVLLFVIGLVLLSVAVVFLLIGGVHGLQQLDVPPWATWLGVGAVAAAAGAIVITRK